MTKKITPNSIVYMHYTLRLQDGSVADSSLDEDKPGRLQMGLGNVSDAFESELLGLKVGDEKRIHLKAADAYGDPDPRNVKMLPEEKFMGQAIEVGSIIAFETQDGEEMPGVIKKIDNGLVVVDFNHPLAGQDLTFDVKIVDIENE